MSNRTCVMICVAIIVFAFAAKPKNATADTQSIREYGLNVLTAHSAPLTNYTGRDGQLTTIFKQASTNCQNLDWTVLAGISKVESNYGTHGGAYVKPDGTISQEIVSEAGARGPMQHMPASWLDFGKGGDINSFYDASAASARHLCAGGAIDGTAGGTYKALRRYYTGKTRYTKDGEWYANKVIEAAANHKNNI